MTRSVPIGVGILVIVIVLAGLSLPVAVAGAVDSQQSTADRERVATAQAIDELDSQDFDTTTFEITVHENGSATWTFRHEQRLADDEAEASFAAFAEEFETEETGLYERFTDQAEALTDTGEETTEREMEATTFNRSATTEYRPGAMGVVEMSFVWEGFADVQEDRIVIGDVFQNMYLAADQSLVIEPEGDLVFTAAEPEGDYTGTTMENASSMTWSGEREFLDGHPNVVLRDADDVGSGTAGTTGWSTGSTLLSWPVVIGATAVVVGAVVAAAWYRTRREDGSSGEASAESIGPQPEDEASSAETPSESEPAPGSLTEDELLTDEDRVIRLIRENGGRMKQVNIVEETGWSKSKVSMLLSEMEREGSISKLRVGRENIISLEGYEPEAAKSPFEE